MLSGAWLLEKKIRRRVRTCEAECASIYYCTLPRAPCAKTVGGLASVPLEMLGPDATTARARILLVRRKQASAARVAEVEGR